MIDAAYILVANFPCKYFIWYFIVALNTNQSSFSFFKDDKVTNQFGDCLDKVGLEQIGAEVNFQLGNFLK